MSAQKICMVSLGCPKNLVDSENIVTLLIKEGYEITNSFEDCALVIINTCGFIDPAIAESMANIKEAFENCAKVIVTGCLGLRKDYLYDAFPNLCAVTGPHSPNEVLEEVKKALPLPKNTLRGRVPKGGVLLTPSHYAYLKISEGCSHRCSFCIIPKIRGPLQSFKATDLLQRAKDYVNRGVKELLVVAQDTSAYAQDCNYPPFMGYERGDLYALTRELGKLGVWVRVHYTYPYPHAIELVKQMSEGLVLPYLDIPLQHVNPRILKLMKRPGNYERNLELIESWRKICPDITIRSTFIAGFPGETEDEFNELLDFIKEAKLDRVGCFAYSPVHNADANLLPDQIPEEVKLDRVDRFMRLQQEISQAKLAQKIGKELDVIIDEVEDYDRIIGRTKGDAPEIDGVIYLHTTKEHTPKVGDILKAKVTANDEYDLEGDIIN